MDDRIYRTAVIEALHRYFKDGFDSDKWWNSTHVLAAVSEALPTGETAEKVREEERERLLEQIRQAEPFNNSDCPKWVLQIIRGTKHI